MNYSGENEMSKNRRAFFKRFRSLGAGLLVGQKALKAQENPHAQHTHIQHGQPPKNGTKAHAEVANENFVPVETPDVPKLPWKVVDGVKEFHLIAEPVKVEFVPGRVVDVWGYNGSIPGPTIDQRQLFLWAYCLTEESNYLEIVASFKSVLSQHHLVFFSFPVCLLPFCTTKRYWAPTGYFSSQE